MSLRLQPYISLWDKSFNASNTRLYNITMQLSLHGFYFAVFHPDTSKYLGMEAYRFDDVDEEGDLADKFDLIINHTVWFGYPFKKVKLLYHNVYSTLVPLPLFSEEKKNAFLGFNQPVIDQHRIETDFLKNSDSVNVYYLPDLVAEKVHKLWPNAEISHFSSQFIECLMLNYKNKLDKSTLFLQVNQGSFNLVSLSNNKLLYHNSFLFNTKEDFIYFLLAAMEQLGFNPENTNLMLMGNIDKSDDLFELMHRYVGKCSFVEKSSGFAASYVLNEIKHHQYYVLFNALQCEL